MTSAANRNDGRFDAEEAVRALAAQGLTVIATRELDALRDAARSQLTAEGVREIFRDEMQDVVRTLLRKTAAKNRAGVTSPAPALDEVTCRRARRFVDRVGKGSGR